MAELLHVEDPNENCGPGCPVWERSRMSNFEDSIAHKAHGLVHGDRAKTYGHPRFDFTAIGKVWTGLLQDVLKEGVVLDAYRVAILMTGLKLCRLVKSPDHHDSRVDTIGYMLTMERLDEPEETPRCPAHGKEKCEACSQNPDPSRCQCGYFESTGMHWDTCPGRIRSFPEHLPRTAETKIHEVHGGDKDCWCGFKAVPLNDAPEDEDGDIDYGDYDVHGRPVDLDIEAVQRVNQLKFNQLNVWFEAGESKLINGREIKNGEKFGQIIGFPFMPGTTVKVEKPPVPEPTVDDLEKAMSEFPEFGTPEFDKRAEKVAAEQAKDWPKFNHAHKPQEPCIPGCPVFDVAKPSQEYGMPPEVFGFTGEQVEIQPSTPWERSD